MGLRLCRPPAPLAVPPAKRPDGFNGEIVSIDSRQVYKEMEIGTGKLPLSKNPESQTPSSKEAVGEEGQPRENPSGWDPETRRVEELASSEGSSVVRIEKKEGFWIINGVRIHLYDLISPDEELNAVQYARLAADRIEKIWSRGKIPFLVGGAGLYLEILLGMVEVAKIPKNPELREDLGKLSQEDLVARLEDVDPERARTIDKNSPHRVMRAIEIAVGRSKHGFGELQGLESRAGSSKTVEVLPEGIEPLWIGLNAPREYLYDKIDRRVEKMMEAGLLDEVKSLVDSYGWNAPALDSIGYIEFKKYFESERKLEEQIQRVKYNSHAYARRQLTWFRRNEDINWLDITDEGFEQEAEKMVESYLRK